MKLYQIDEKNGRERKLLFLLLLAFVMVAAAVLVTHHSLAAQETAVAGQNSAESVDLVESAVGPNCRYGVTSWRTEHAPFVQQLNVGWAYSFGLNIHSLASGVEFMPMIRMKQQFDSQGKRLPGYNLTNTSLSDGPGGLGPLVQANPGKLWLVGNEVDRVFWQDDMMPDIYAQAYHDVYWFIKDRDPTAQIAISGLVQVTPGRLQYLDIVLDSYLKKYGTPMPVDVWNLHVYILPERRATNTPPFYADSRAAIALGTDPNLAIWESDGTPNQCSRADVYCYAEHDNMTIFASQVRAMRQWMKDNGEQDKPLILTEFSLLYSYVPEAGGCFLQDEFGNCFTPQRVTNFMNAALNYLETAVDTNIGYPQDNYRLVQQWAWYAMNDQQTGTPNKLVNDNSTGFTLMGNTYKNRIAAQPLAVNLVAEKAAFPVVKGGTSADISVTFRNNGNAKVGQSFTVTFYSNTSLTNVIGSVTIPATVEGCARRDYTATVTWNGLTPGVNRYWAVLDTGEAISEQNEADNIISGFVLVEPQQIFLPLTRNNR